jgi:hypothetical protein
MASQTLLFTVMPRGMSVDAETLPVSVYVSPRLFADGDPADPARPSLETTLSSFPDWLGWTRHLKESGLSLTFACAGATLTAAAATDILEPSLWEALFKAETLVRSHRFDDYTNHQVISSSMRSALSLIKGLYQKASVELALPESLARSRQSEANHYETLQQLVGGLEVNWNDERSYQNRYEYQSSAQGLAGQLRQQPPGPDGLVSLDRLDPQAAQRARQEAQRTIAQGYMAAQKIPQGTPLEENPTDFAKLMDFHQAIGSLNSYPELLRALGLVIDFELPKDFVAIASPGQLSVTDAIANWGWALPPSVPPQATAYVHAQNMTSGFSFFTAPRAFQAPAANIAGAAAGQPPLEMLGLLALRPLSLNAPQFGLSQVDVDGAMHKVIMTAETVQRDRADRPGPAASPHPEVFDPRITLPSLRSGGFSLFADERGAKLIKKLAEAKAFNAQLTPQPPQPALFYAEDLVHGYRLDIWDSHSQQWHSLHRRNAAYSLEGLPFNTTDQEGFTQLAAVQPAPDTAKPQPKDIYLQETIARWSGWSLSVPFPDKVLSSDPDPTKVLDQPKSEQNLPETPFKMTSDFTIVKNSLPSLRFGRRYRLRARVVDLCGNSLTLDHPLLPQLSARFALPADPAGAAYVRYEPVISPQVVLRDAKGVTEPGSQLDRLVIRTFNTDPSKDADAADLTGSDRHILPPRTSVEMAERLGMLDDETGKLSRDPALYSLLFAKDGADLPTVTVEVAGKAPGTDAGQEFPLVESDRIDSLPYIPDVLARGAALRDLPGTPAESIGTVQPGIEPAGPVPYRALDDAQPRPGSATLISFGGERDWQTRQPFRLALADDGAAAPHWDAQNRLLTVSLPKGTSTTVPLTSYLAPEDLKLMGIWQWLREQIEVVTQNPLENLSVPPEAIAHILQRTVEGGHWMLTPPRLIHLVHAVQQPIGRPVFTALSVQHQAYDESNPDETVLQKAPETPFKKTENVNQDDLNLNELDAITAWRHLGATDVYLLGGLQVHGASTAKIDILAEWDDPVDDLRQSAPSTIHQATPVDEVPIAQLSDHRITVNPGSRGVGYYVEEQDLLCFVRQGDALGNVQTGALMGNDDAPCHRINDTKHHRIRYTAVATSRYRDYFPQQDADGQPLDASHFSRWSQPVVVDVPASSRPVAPQIAYVLPTFGWQRQTQTNLKRSVRFGGGLRVYLDRPWFSSGEGELLGVSLYNGLDIEAEPGGRDRWKPFVTQWGNDPIWQTKKLSLQTPNALVFPDAIAQENSLSLEEDPSKRVDVVGYPVAFDAERQQWYCDLTLEANATYSPFVRLALVRYQPYALRDAKLSRVVLADFVQLTPERSATITADPYQPNQLRITVSGIVPNQPKTLSTTVKLQVRDETLSGDLAWRDAPNAGEFNPDPQALNNNFSPPILYTGTLRLQSAPQPNRYRLVISEYETLITDENSQGVPLGSRLIYCETLVLDDVLLAGPAIADNRTTL